MGGAGYEASLPVSPLRVAQNVTLSTLTELHRQGLRVAALSAFADTEPVPLRWGEVIPLSFLNSTLNVSSLVVLGQPTRRTTDEVSMVPELLTLGAALFRALDALEQRVLVLISGDLARAPGFFCVL